MHYLTHRHALAKPVQFTLCLLVLCLSLSMLLLGGRVLLASLNQYRASSFLTDWEKKRHIPSEKAWQVAEQAMHNAIDWYPSANGAYAEQLGYMWQWRSYDANPAQVSIKEHKQQAISAFRTATELRPTWPYAWSGLAYAKLVADELDQEFTDAMQNAAHYGPSRIGVNRRLAEIGLISWSKLDTALRELTLEQARRVARYSPPSRAQLFVLAAELQSVDLLCQHLQDGIKPCAPVQKVETSSLNSTSVR
ncbi:MAG: hypothetical protein KBD92_04360 [Thiopseudomonas sp.]|nr:hypothetical protein [Thiopseudomonas sp.]